MANPDDVIDLEHQIVDAPAYKQQQLIQQVVHMAMQDPGLAKGDKERLVSRMNEPGFFEKLFKGSMGAAIAYAVAKYMKMNKETRVLMSMLGFGIGNMLLTASEKKSKPNNGVYEVN